VKNLLAVVLLVVFGAVALSQAQNADPQPTPSLYQKWEYKVVPLSRNEGESHATSMERVLNEAGREGWDLAIAESGGFIFKRPFASPQRQPAPKPLPTPTYGPADSIPVPPPKRLDPL
jgi:hypothetical protein